VQRLLQVLREINACRNAIDISEDVAVTKGSAQMLVYSASDRLGIFSSIVYENCHAVALYAISA